MFHWLSTRFGHFAAGLIFAFVSAAVGWAYIGTLYIIASLWTGAGHGNYAPVRILSFPHNYGGLFWPVVFALAALSRLRFFCGSAILLIAYYYFDLWINDAFGELRRFDAGFASAFKFVFWTHLLFTANLVLLLTYQLVKTSRDKMKLNASRRPAQ